ncbi:MAG: hypothetical protein J6M15_09490 [Prevotella sp.]|nr:hypothetical protein [Prevotella sp.]
MAESNAILTEYEACASNPSAPMIDGYIKQKAPAKRNAFAGADGYRVG